MPAVNRKRIKYVCVSEPRWVIQLVHSALCSRHNSSFESHQYITCPSMWIKWLSCHVCHQEVRPEVNLKNLLHTGNGEVKHCLFGFQL